MKTKLLLLATSLVIALSGCVSSKKYHTLQGQYDSLKKQYDESQIALAESRTGIKSLDAMLADARKTNAELKENYTALQKSLDNSINQNAQGNVNISKLVDEINASNAYIKQLVQAKTKSDSLNIALTNKLTRSLSTDELKEVDVKVYNFFRNALFT